MKTARRLLRPWRKTLKFILKAIRFFIIRLRPLKWIIKKILNISPKFINKLQKIMHESDNDALPLDKEGADETEILRLYQRLETARKFLPADKNAQPVFKLAWFTPLPPQKTGIAHYNATLLKNLSPHFIIDIYTDAPDTVDEAIMKNFIVQHWEKFPPQSHQYDHIVYHLGNNAEFHAYMYQLLLHYPGIVVLHDFYLSGLFSSMGLLARECLYSHGFAAIKNTLTTYKTINMLTEKWPCNRRVLNHASAVIFHSSFAKKLSEKFYPKGFDTPYYVINHLKDFHFSDALDRQQIKEKLGYDSKETIVCSFGFLSYTKNNLFLLHAFKNVLKKITIPLKLIFVGEFLSPEYEKQLRLFVDTYDLKNNIIFTGYVNSANYQNYLNIADIAVQLRVTSCGETSGALLDCLSYGIPTIVNRFATLEDYPDNLVYKIPYPAEEKDLEKALEDLICNPPAREKFRDECHQYILQYHAPSQIAHAYTEMLKECIARDRLIQPLYILKQAQNELKLPLTNKNLKKIAANFVTMHTKDKGYNLLFDVSDTAKQNYVTGIQRVVTNMAEALCHQPEFTRPVVPSKMLNGHLVFPANFANKMIGENLFDQEIAIEIKSQDIFLSLDSAWDRSDDYIEIFERLHKKKGKIYMSIHDLIPVRHPEFVASPMMTINFTRWFNTVTQHSDGLICVSKATADDVIAYLKEHPVGREKPLSIGYFHLGANIVKTVDEKKISPALHAIFNEKASQTFLMAGTLEPRKGHAVVLEAFEYLWQKGHNIRLCLVGKHGWLIDNLVKKIHDHPQFNHRLFWLKLANDNELAYCYQQASALIFASYAEGFGLPLIEAAAFNCPLICSDLAVFREIARDHAIYFKEHSPQGIAETIENWLTLSTPPESKFITPLTWQQSAKQLQQVIFNNQWYQTLTFDKA